ncbi:hypothetical protein JCGZ_15284 [Jatropha curcas]|uniref:Uncharacterized protein n=1 Tax=Jatropha curcas TaxID=180498 RepID=A0A067K626_JATCU|nr:hypothetical protein JCGZ_15284 [Jatropha curcas]
MSLGQNSWVTQLFIQEQSGDAAVHQEQLCHTTVHQEQLRHAHVHQEQLRHATVHPRTAASRNCSSRNSCVTQLLAM